MMKYDKKKVTNISFIYKKFNFFLILICFLNSIFNYNLYANNIDNKICVVGDSFAGYFAINEGRTQFDYNSFPVGQIFKPENIKIFKNSIMSDKYKYILFATGVNDQAKGTDINVFEKQLKEHILLAKKYNKIIFLHTYMMYKGSKGSKFKREDYDDILRRLSKIYENVVYLDMSNLNDEYYLISDGMHYNKYFYKFLKAKLFYEIDKFEYKNKNINWDYGNIDEISIIGNAYNNLFIKYELNKKYKIKNLDIKNLLFYDDEEEIKKFLNSNSKYIIFSFIPNNKNILEPKNFELKLREYINETLYKHKIVYFYTYDNFLNNNISNNVYSPYVYDDILKKLSYEYDNINYIDMYDFTKDEIGNSYRFDLYHAFFDNLYKKIEMNIIMSE